MQPNELRANTFTQIIRKGHPSMIPPCPSLVELAQFEYRIMSARQEFISTKKLRVLTEDETLSALPFDSEEALTVAQLLEIIDSSESTVSKMLIKLCKAEKVDRRKVMYNFLYWRIA